MKYKLKIDRLVISLPKLIVVIKMTQENNMPVEYFRKLSNLMTSRIEKVLVDKGHMTINIDLLYLCANL
jgi:hypothetical protein